MKQIYTLVVIILISLSCKAQSEIIDIENKPSFRKVKKNVYYKDINNFFNGFEGTWLAKRGNKTLKIVLKKLEKEKNDIPYYYDDMDGEYLYTENGVEKINTLNNKDYFKTSIMGASLLKSNHKPPCDDCKPNKRRLSVMFFDRVHDVSATLYLQHTTVNGKPALKGLLYGDGGSYVGENPPKHLSMVIPTGWWTFVKE